MDGPDAENSLFYFESDHLPLRGNPDYSALLKTLVMLEAQRAQLTKQIDELGNQKNYYLKNTDEFLKKIKEGKLETPPEVIMAEIPEINFKKYNCKLPEFPGVKEPSNEGKVRGRQFDQSKSDTFNQLWTYEEQRRLEELLLEFPPEAVEARRFEKIAKALGNRTVRQVASRVQKYFQKLHSSGMPVPGRLPKSKRRYNFLRTRKSMIRPSTFFPAYNVPVDMDSCSSSQTCSSSKAPKEWKPNEEKSRVVEILKAVKEAKISFADDAKHEGYTCDLCLESPVIGIRWHCSHSDCAQDSVDFCSDCMVDQVIDRRKRHPLHHDFVPFGDFEDDDWEDGFESEEEGESEK
ncbi:hypothetical protein ACFFRR_010345 [Megaselia abdita]